jgi:nitrate reductase NapAB chaperone NapD
VSRLNCRNFGSVADVVATLDQHTLTNEGETISQLTGAIDGAKYDVSPGDYRIELYVYENSADILLVRDDLGKLAPSGQVHVEGNIVVVLHTTDQEALKRLVADLRD